MPSGHQHRKLTREFLGWDIPEVHRIMDAASTYLGGRHRVVGHNLRALEAIELLFGRAGRTVAVLHILQDARIITGGSPPPRRPPARKADSDAQTLF